MKCHLCKTGEIVREGYLLKCSGCHTHITDSATATKSSVLLDCFLYNYENEDSSDDREALSFSSAKIEEEIIYYKESLDKELKVRKTLLYFIQRWVYQFGCFSLYFPFFGRRKKTKEIIDKMEQEYQKDIKQYI